MKEIIFSLLTAVSIISFVSCERHSWEDSAEGKKDGTKNLYPQDQKKEGKKDHSEH